MKTVGINPVIVHGGGPQIGKELNKLKLEFKFQEWYKGDYSRNDKKLFKKCLMKI